MRSSSWSESGHTSKFIQKTQEELIMLYTDFDEWAFIQCVTLGHKIDAIKNDLGINIAFINTTTLERFYL